MKRFQEEVYRMVRKIPKGKVTTYGEIALKLGKPRWARQVGWALHQNKYNSTINNQSLRFSTSVADLKDRNTPCHRVVNRNGRLAPNFAFDGAKEQRRRLLLEKVVMKDNMHVDLSKSLWIT